MKIRQVLKIILWCSLFTGLTFSATKGPRYKDIRAMGMGNSTVAVTTDRTAIFHNPAGLSQIRDSVELSFTPIAAAIDGIFLTILKEMIEHGDKLSDINNVDQEFIDILNKYDGKWVGLEYNPEFTIAAENIGFGMYSVFPLGIRIESGHLIPKLGLRGQRDLVFTWAVGIPLRHENNHCGISVEYLQRTPIDMLTTYTETFIIFDEIAQNPFGIIGDYSNIQHGVSFDVGFMHDFNGFRLAYDIKDILAVIGGDMVAPPRIDLGCAYYFPQLEKVKFIKNLILSLEFSDIFGIEHDSEKYEQFWKKTHFGAEFDLHYAAFRVGLNQGYPTAGLGLKLGVFKLDYAYFTEELGYYAGQLEKNQHIVSIGFNLSIPRKNNKNQNNKEIAPEDNSKEITPKDNIKMDKQENEKNKPEEKKEVPQPINNKNE